MIDPSSFPVLFLGPMEILLVGLVLIVILFGPKAPEIAEQAGTSVGQFQKSKKEVEQEVEDVSEELDEVRGDMQIDDIDEKKNR